MISRSAQGLYWMGRYFERAEHLCRLLRLQVEVLVDRPVAEIYFGWSRIYTALGRQPPWGDLDPNGSDDYTLADSYTLAGDLTFEQSNSDSVWNCFALGPRERPPSAPLHQHRDVDLPELGLAEDPLSRPRGHLEGFPRELLCGHHARDCHFYRGGRSDHVPRRGLALYATRTFHRASPAFGCIAPRSVRRRPRTGTRPRTRTGRACCVHARHSTPTNVATASRFCRIGCWT